MFVEPPRPPLLDPTAPTRPPLPVLPPVLLPGSPPLPESPPLPLLEPAPAWPDVCSAGFEDPEHAAAAATAKPNPARASP